MTSPAARTIGELRASGHVRETVKQEMRRNLLARLRSGEQLLPGIVGYDETVLPQLRLDCTGFEVETQISLRVCKANLKIVEVPSIEHPRVYGQSNLRTFRDGWRVLKTILKERSTTVYPTDLLKAQLNMPEHSLHP